MIPVILAGGAGTRFWPLSRRDRPKQLLSLWDDDRPLIEVTVDRLLPLCDEGRSVHVVCPPSLTGPIEDVLRRPETVEFIEEPAPRDTAPAMALATARLEARHGDEPVAFFPSDHFVGDRTGFHRCARFAAGRAREGAIVTIGIPPSRPETGYGYIETTRPVADTDGEPESCAVERFVEKPDRRRATRYLKSGHFLWNAGIFAFRPSTLWAEFRDQEPGMWSKIEQIRTASAPSESDRPAIETAFEALEAISVDYAIMEGARRVEVVPALFRWSDVGHWGALDEVLETDDRDNIVEGDAVLEEVTDSVVVSKDDRVVAAGGLDGVVVVDTDDALLVIPKDRAQDVRKLVAELERRGWTEFL